MNDPIEAETVPEMPLATIPQGGAVGVALPASEIKGNPTAQELRVVEVSEALLPAYQKASTLELTEAEVAAIMAPFPDDAVEIRPHDGLIYLPHICISDRLNQVLNPGKWSLVCRRHWLEGNTMYGEYIMLIRGCYVGESVGGHPYQPNNPKTNYSDTLESTAAEALRRIAGKRLSCGSQVWHPPYARDWVAKNAVEQGGKWRKRPQNAPGLAEPPPPPRQSTPQAPSPAAPAQPPAAPRHATTATLQWMLKEIKAAIGGENRRIAEEYFVKCGQLLPTESIDELPLRFVPINKTQLAALVQCIANFEAGGDAVSAFEQNPQDLPPKPTKTPAPAPAKPVEVPRDSNPDPNSPDAPWRSFPMPWGKEAGTNLADLDKKYLYGLWANYEVETEYNGRPKKPETIAKDHLFRAMLDEAGEHYEFTKD